MSLPSYSVTDPPVFAFVLLAVLLVALLAWGVAFAWRRDGASEGQTRRAVLLTVFGSAVWLAVTWTLAARGVLLEWDRRPPPFAMLVTAIVAIACGLAFTRVGGRLARHVPLAVLVGVQAFRWPLELAMHRLAERGIVPEQMSYSGRNWDILTGISAIVVAALLASGRAGRGLALAWNVAGLALLVNVVTIAIVSTPVFAYFGPDRLNIWVMMPPFVWLPAVMVLAALAGHLVIFRSLRIGAREGRAGSHA